MYKVNTAHYCMVCVFRLRIAVLNTHYSSSCFQWHRFARLACLVFPLIVLSQRETMLTNENYDLNSRIIGSVCWMMLGILFVLMSTTMLGVSTTPAPKIDPLTTTKTAFNIKYMFYSNRMKLSLDRMSRLKQQNIKSHFPPPDPQQIAEEIHLIYKYGIKLGENPPLTPFSLIQCDWFGKQRHYGYFSLRQCFPRTVWHIDDQFVKRVFFRILDLCLLILIDIMLYCNTWTWKKRQHNGVMSRNRHPLSLS